MAPAQVVHHMSGRTRFRVIGKREDAAYFVRLREQMSQCPGVISVATTQVSGSVLVHHEAADPDVLVAFARTMDLFDAQWDGSRASDHARPPALLVANSIAELDRWVRSKSEPTTDLRSLAITGLIAAAGFQLLRGRVFPPAVTLLAYAFGVASSRWAPTAANDDAPAELARK